MEEVADWAALFTLISIPPVLLFWLIIHPFNGFWRKLGTGVTYPLVLAILAPIVVLIVLYREPLLSIRFGVKEWLIVPSFIFLLVAFIAAFLRQRQMRPTTRWGLPEISGKGMQGKLIREGIFARVRHPIYVLEGGSLMVALALFTNNLVVYLLLAAYFPVIYLVVLFEERELMDRFGEEYERYRAEVPAFLPRLRKR